MIQYKPKRMTFASHPFFILPTIPSSISPYQHFINPPLHQVITLPSFMKGQNRLIILYSFSTVKIQEDGLGRDEQNGLILLKKGV